jgi:hypothetical protein
MFKTASKDPATGPVLNEQISDNTCNSHFKLLPSGLFPSDFTALYNTLHNMCSFIKILFFSDLKTRRGTLEINNKHLQNSLLFIS